MLLLAKAEALRMASRTRVDINIGRQRVIAGATAGALAVFAPTLAGATFAVIKWRRANHGGDHFHTPCTLRAGAAQTESELMDAMAKDQVEEAKEQTQLRQDQIRLKQDKKLEKELEKEVEKDRKLSALAVLNSRPHSMVTHLTESPCSVRDAVANARAAGDTVLVAELDAEIAVLLAQEAKYKSEEAALRAEMKALEQEFAEMEQKLAMERTKLDSLKGLDEDFSAGSM